MLKETHRKYERGEEPDTIPILRRVVLVQGVKKKKKTPPPDPPAPPVENSEGIPAG